MTKETVQSKVLRQTANRRAHPIWRGLFIYSITCNLTIVLTLALSGRMLLHDTYPILTDLVAIIYIVSEIYLLLFSPFFIGRFGGLAKFGLFVALINTLFLSISGRT